MNEHSVNTSQQCSIHFYCIFSICNLLIFALLRENSYPLPHSTRMTFKNLIRGWFHFFKARTEQRRQNFTNYVLSLTSQYSLGIFWFLTLRKISDIPELWTPTSSLVFLISKSIIVMIIILYSVSTICLALFYIF